MSHIRRGGLVYFWACLVVQDESEPGRGGDRKVEVRVWPIGLVVRREDLHLIPGLG